MTRYSILILTFLFFGCKNDQEVKYYENGQVLYSVDLKNGKRNGKLTEYYQSGIVKSKSEWLDGKADGVTQHFFEDGSLKEISKWKNGTQNGTGQQFYENGQVKYIAKYLEGNLKDTSYFFFENGKLGEQKIYNQEGKTIYILKYDKTGKKIVDLVLPLINWGLDTIKLNESVEISLKYILPISGQLKAEFGFLNANSTLLPDTVISGGGSDIFFYKRKLTDLGKTGIYISITHNKPEHDTLSADGLVTKHTFFVKPLP